jgi:hypothetical protein
MSEQNNDQKEEVAKIDEVSDEALLRAAGTGVAGPTKMECGAYPSQRC